MRTSSKITWTLYSDAHICLPSKKRKKRIATRYEQRWHGRNTKNSNFAVVVLEIWFGDQGVASSFRLFSLIFPFIPRSPLEADFNFPMMEKMRWLIYMAIAMYYDNVIWESGFLFNPGCGNEEWWDPRRMINCLVLWSILLKASYRPQHQRHYRANVWGAGSKWLSHVGILLVMYCCTATDRPFAWCNG